MNKEEFIQKLIEDKTEKNRIYSNFFNFYWTLNLISATVFGAGTANFEVALLFSILSVGTFIATLVMLSFNTNKINQIHKLINVDGVDSPKLYSKPNEFIWSLIYLSSFVLLAAFWVSLLLQELPLSN